MAESKNQTNQSAPATMIYSIGELNRVLRALAVQSVGRAMQIQSQTITNASVSYISWLERLGGLFFLRTAPSQSREPHDGNHDTKRAADRTPAEANLSPPIRRTTAHTLSTKRKTGPVAKRRDSPKRSRRTKR